MKNTKIATVYQLIKFTTSLLHPLDKSWPNRNNPSKFAVLQYRFRKSSNEFRQPSVFRRPQHGFFDLLHPTFVLNKGRKRRVGFTHGKCSKNYLSNTGTPAPHTNINRFPMMHISIFNSKQDLIKFKNSIPSMKSRLCKIPINRMPYFYLNPP